MSKIVNPGLQRQVAAFALSVLAIPISLFKEMMSDDAKFEEPLKIILEIHSLHGECLKGLRICEALPDAMNIANKKAKILIKYLNTANIDPEEKLERWNALWCCAAMLVVDVVNRCEAYGSMQHWKDLNEKTWNFFEDSLLPMTPDAAAKGKAIYEKIA